MKNWRQWGKGIGAFLRRLVVHVLRTAVGEPPGQPPIADDATKVEPGAAADLGTSESAARPSASGLVRPLAPSASAPGEGRVLPIPAPIATPAPGEAPPTLAPAGKWLNDSITALTGTIDLAPWVLPVRTYKVYEPAVLAAKPCVLLVLHGCQQTADDIAEGTRLNEHADERGWLVVYPEQAIAANKFGCWNWFDPANNRGAGECALIVAMQDAVRARYELDYAPTFLAGMSAGGALASLLALSFPERWAAVAIHSGLPFGAATDPWGARRAMREGARNLIAARALRLVSPGAPPVPAIILHGNEDAVVHRRNADLLVRQFLGWNGYFPDAEDWENAPLPPVEDAHVKTLYGHPYILRDYGRPDRAPVCECEVVGMGHAWSGGDSALPYHDELGPDASALMVEFFAGIAKAAPAAGAGPMQ
jgi:poly(hydroxyalkanoate) depolymerase family esterase